MPGITIRQCCSDTLDLCWSRWPCVTNANLLVQVSCMVRTLCWKYTHVGRLLAKLRAKNTVAIFCVHGGHFPFFLRHRVILRGSSQLQWAALVFGADLSCACTVSLVQNPSWLSRPGLATRPAYVRHSCSGLDALAANCTALDLLHHSYNLKYMHNNVEKWLFLDFPR